MPASVHHPHGGTFSGTLNNGSPPAPPEGSSSVASNIVLMVGTLAGIGNTDRLFTLTANGGGPRQQRRRSAS